MSEETLLSVFALVVAALGVTASIVTSNRTAKKYGDLAGAQAAQRYAEKKNRTGKIASTKSFNK